MDRKIVIFITISISIYLGYMINVKGKDWNKWITDKKHKLPYWLVSLLKLCGVKEDYYLFYSIVGIFVITILFYFYF